MKKESHYKFSYFINWSICLLPIILIFSRAIADIIVVTSCVYFLINNLKNKNFIWVQEPWIKISFLIYIWFIFISFFSYNQEIAFTRAFGWIRFIIFITALKYLYLADNIWRKRLLTISLLAIGIIIVSMLSQLFALLQNIENIKFGYGYFRLLGPFDTVNKSAIMLSLFFFPATFGLLYDYEKVLKKKYYFFILFFLITFTCIFFSGHRSSSFIFIISSFLFLIYLFKEEKKFFFKLIKPISLILVLITFISSSQFNRIVKSSFEVLINYKKTSYWAGSETGLKMFKEHPITGVGLKNFHIACEYPSFISDEHKKYNQTPWWGVTRERIKESNLEYSGIDKGNYDIKPPTCYTHVHNFYISLLAESGLLGFSMFLVLIFKISKYFYQNSKFLKRTVAPGIIIVLIPLITPMLPVTNFFSNWNAIMIWLLIGWALSYSKNQTKYAK